MSAHIGNIHQNTAARDFYLALKAALAEDQAQGLKASECGWRSTRELALSLDSVCAHTRIYEVETQLGAGHWILHGAECEVAGCTCIAEKMEKREERGHSEARGRAVLRTYYRIVPVDYGVE